MVPPSTDPRDFRTLGTPVREEHAGWRIDAYLAKTFPFLSRSGWRKRLDLGELRIQEKAVRAAYRLSRGDQVWFYHPAEREPDVAGQVALLHQDGVMACVEKPAGLPMHESGAFRHRTMKTAIEDLLGPEWAAVHRLDLETSGLVLCAGTLAARHALSEQIRARQVRKTYQALCHGKVDRHPWTASGPIGDLVESAIRIKKWVVPGGLSSRTDFRCIESLGSYSLLEAQPHTGRTNQIRIHAAHAGYPLVGDKLFHPDEAVFLEYFANGTTPEVVRRTGHDRCCLHASGLAFSHPETGALVEVFSDMPTDMRALLESFRAASD